MRRRLKALGLVFTGIMLCAQHAQAANGTWTNLASGAWGTTGNWLSGTVAEGTDAVADFSTLNITNAMYVNNDTARTVGQLRFGDLTTASHDWTLTNSTLTLAVSSGTPTVTVSNRMATINLALQGTQGFTKTGAGTLAFALRNATTVAGVITVNEGTLQVNAGGLRNSTGSVFVESGARLNLDSGSSGGNEMTNSLSLSGTGISDSGALYGSANSVYSGPITLLTDSKITHGWNNFTLNGPISGANKSLTFTSGQNGITVNSALSLGTGALTINGNTYAKLNASNNFSGGTTVSTGTGGGLKIGHVNALGTGGLTVNMGNVDLNEKNISISSLSGSGGVITDLGAAGTTTLTVTQSVATTYSGVISNGTSRTVALVKTGSGTLTLAGRNTYTGATTVNAGGLIGVTGGTCSNSSVIVADGATNGVRVALLNGQWACSNLTYSAGTTTLDINFGGSQPSATIAPLRVAGNLDMGTVGIIVTNGVWPTTPGIYPLVSYAGTLSGTVPALALSLPVGVTATLVNNTGSKRIDLNVTTVTWTPSSYNTWTNLVSGNASGSWGNSANWSNNIPNAVDAIADFSTLNITADAFVTNDAPRTVGQLRFGDMTASHNWTLTNAALTLATTTVQPVIDVTNQTATIYSVLLGTQGFVKQGSGTLSIRGRSTMTGDVTVRQGTLFIANGVLDTTASVIVEDGARLQILDSSVIANPLFLSGQGPGAAGALHGQGNQVCNGPITLLTDSKISHSWNNFTLSGPISGTDKNLILQAGVSGQPGISVTNSISLGTGALSVIGDTYTALNASNSFSGGTTVGTGSSGGLKIGHVNALGTGGLTVNSGNVNLSTWSLSLASLSGTGGIITDTGAAGTTTLTVNQSVATTYSGVISNGASRVLALVKSGSGLLTLAGTNTYTGATAVSNGTLAVSGALTASGVTVCAGAAFAAGTTGVVGRATLGGTLTFENNSRLLVDVAPAAADTVEAAGNVVINTGVEVRLSGNQEKSGSWEVIKTTGGTVQGSDPVLVGGLHGAKLTRTATAIVLTIPPKGTMIRIL